MRELSAIEKEIINSMPIVDIEDNAGLVIRSGQVIGYEKEEIE